MKGIIMHQPQHHWDISKLIDKVYGIMVDLDEILRVDRREIVSHVTDNRVGLECVMIIIIINKDIFVKVVTSFDEAILDYNN